MVAARLQERFGKYGPEVMAGLARLTLLTAPDIAELTGLSVQYVYKLLASGQIRRAKLGRSVRATLQDVLAFIERNVEEQA